jgi:hypothetical protein
MKDLLDFFKAYPALYRLLGPLFLFAAATAFFLTIVWPQMSGEKFLVVAWRSVSTKNKVIRVLVVGVGILALLLLGAGLHAAFTNGSIEAERIETMPDGGQTIYKNGIAISVPAPAAQEAMRKDLYEFHNRILTRLYGDSNGFVYEIYSKQFGNQGHQPKDLNGAIGGLLRHYVEEDFAHDFTKLTDAIRSDREIPYLEVRDLGRSFFRSYDKFAFWVQQTALKSGLDLKRSGSYQRWNKTDAEFLRDFNSMTAKKGMDFFRGDISDRPYRIRDSADGKKAGS